MDVGSPELSSTKSSQKNDSETKSSNVASTSTPTSSASSRPKEVKIAPKPPVGTLVTPASTSSVTVPRPTTVNSTTQGADKSADVREKRKMNNQGGVTRPDNVRIAPAEGSRNGNDSWQHEIPEVSQFHSYTCVYILTYCSSVQVF